MYNCLCSTDLVFCSLFNDAKETTSKTRWRSNYSERSWWLCCYNNWTTTGSRNTEKQHLKKWSAATTYVLYLFNFYKLCVPFRRRILKYCLLIESVQQTKWGVRELSAQDKKRSRRHEEDKREERNYISKGGVNKNRFHTGTEIITLALFSC